LQWQALQVVLVASVIVGLSVLPFWS